MKRLSVLILVGILVFMGSAGSAERRITPKMLDSYDYSIEEWCESNTNRVIFTTCLVIDCILDLANDLTAQDQYQIFTEALAQNSVYVAKEEDMVTAFCFGFDDVALVSYVPQFSTILMETAELDNGTDNADICMKQLYYNGTFDAYYNVDTEQVVELLTLLLDE